MGGAGATLVRTICLKHGKIDRRHPGEEDVGDLIFPEERKGGNKRKVSLREFS